MFEFFERLGDLFSNGDGSHYDTSGHESVVDEFDGSKLDLSQYSPDDIEDAVRNALGTGDGGTLPVTDMIFHLVLHQMWMPAIWPNLH